MKSTGQTMLRLAKGFYADLLRNAPPPKPWEPHLYQKKFVQFLVSRACAAGWLDPGLGKTSCALAAFKILKNKGMAHRMLVIAPLRVCWLVWPKELLKWTEFAKLKMVVLHGDSKDELLYEDADIYVINPEGMEWFFDSGGMEIVKPDILTIDESRKFKDPKSQRFKILKKHIHKFRRRWTLTGTPAPNGYMDLFGQMYITDGGHALGQYITYYRNEYFDSTGFGGHTYELQETGAARIQTRLKPLVMRLDGEDYLTLPKFVWNDVKVELPPKARRVYDEMETIMITLLENMKSVTAVSAAAASIKCRQIANGGLFEMSEVNAEGLLIKASRTWVDLHDEKIKAAESIIDELGGKPVLMAYDFEHDLARILKHFGKDTPRIGVNIRRDIQLERMWNQGKLPLLLGHPASMGHGLNLQESGNDIIWHSLTWDQELFDQMNKRIRRQGSKHKVVRVHRIIALNTIDEPIVATLYAKEKIQRGLLDSLRVFYQSRTTTAKRGARS